MKPETNNTQRARLAWPLAAAAIVVIGLVGAAIWRVMPERRIYFTDSQTIREPLKAASPRDILWQPPERLAEVVNAVGENYEARFSWDGLSLYFVRGKAGQNADIYVSHRTPAGWTPAEVLENVSSGDDDLGPQPTMDGESLYFYSDRPGGSGGYDLWVSQRGPAGWRPATNLGPQVNSEFNDYGPTTSPDGKTLYFSSDRPQPGDERMPDPHAWPATLREERFHRTYDLYSASITERGMGQARPLATLNTPHNEGSPCVSPVGDFLYFASDRPGGQGGYDLFRSRVIRGEPRPAVSLGAAINTPANELDPGLTLGGFALYFSSDRTVTTAGFASEAPQPTGATPQATKPAPRSYSLYQTSSREVFTDTDVVNHPINWAGLWSRILPSLLWALLALLLLLLMLAFLRAARDRKLSLIMRCLLVSLLLHSLCMLLLSFWRVSASIAEALGSGDSGVHVTLAGPGAGEIAAQIFSPVTDFAAASVMSTAVLTASEQQAPPPSPASLDTQVEIANEPSPVQFQSQPEFVPAATDAALKPAAPINQSIAAVTPSAAPLMALELPTNVARISDAENQPLADVTAGQPPKPSERGEFFAPTSQPSASIAQLDAQRPDRGASDMSTTLIQAVATDTTTAGRLSLNAPPSAPTALHSPAAQPMQISLPTDVAPAIAAAPERSSNAAAIAVGGTVRGPVQSSIAPSGVQPTLVSAAPASGPGRVVDSNLPSSAFQLAADARPVTDPSSGLAASPLKSNGPSSSGAPGLSLPKMEEAKDTGRDATGGRGTQKGNAEQDGSTNVAALINQGSPSGAAGRASLNVGGGMGPAGGSTVVSLAPAAGPGGSGSAGTGGGSLVTDSGRDAGQAGVGAGGGRGRARRGGGGNSDIAGGTVGDGRGAGAPGPGSGYVGEQGNTGSGRNGQGGGAGGIGGSGSGGTGSGGLGNGSGGDGAGPGGSGNSAAYKPGSAKGLDFGLRLPTEMAPPPDETASRGTQPQNSPRRPTETGTEYVGRIRGVVTDGSTGEPLARVTIRLELPDGASQIARTGPRGRYELSVPEAPAHFAISASRDGYDPKSANIPGAALRVGDVMQNFSLAPHSADVIVVEAVPEVHHVGNDRHEGSINSQFQTTSEGESFSTTFELTQQQAAAQSPAELTLMAKGVQCPSEIYINGTLLDAHLSTSPRDGSFGSYSLPIEAGLLTAGSNSLEITTVNCSGDLDDFEFVNVQVRLAKSAPSD